MSDRVAATVRHRRLLVLVACFLLFLGVGCGEQLRPTPVPGSGAVTSSGPGGTETPSATLTAARTSMPAAVPSATRAIDPAPSVTLPPTTVASVSATPSALAPTLVDPASTRVEPGAYVISDVVLFDGAHGRLYAHGRAGEGDKTLVLSATDGGLLAAYDYAGALGLDAAHRRLYVDAAGDELVILNADTGEKIAAVVLPRQEGYLPVAIPPQADPVEDQVLAFRQNVVYVADGASGRIVRTIPFEFEKSEDCRSDEGPYPIEWAAYDPLARTLYLSYLSYVCTPWYGYGIISYDLASGQEIAQGGDYAFQAAAAGGRLYGSSWHRFGIGYLWVWRDGQPWLRSSEWSSRPRLILDEARERLYGDIGGSLGVLDADSMRLLFVLPWPAEGQMTGVDSFTDQLYFLQDGELRPMAASRILEPTARSLVPAPAPKVSVDVLARPPDWPADRTIIGIWGVAQPTDRCYAFAQQGGSLLISNDGGQSWELPAAGLPECRYVSCVAVSPGFAQDHTLLVGLVGLGVFRSTDGGRLWKPASAGLGSMSVQELILSPGFGADRTAFVRVATGGPYRSTDGGQTWQTLSFPTQLPVAQFLLSPGFAHDRTALARLSNNELYRSRDAGLTWQDLGQALQPLALSPEFDRDGIIMGTVPDGNDLLISRDGGTGWQVVGKTPGAVPLDWLSLAPLFDKWGVAFARGRDPIPTQTGTGAAALYRTGDGGLSWQQMRLPSGEPLGIPASATMTFLYAPDIEQNRPIYLLLTQADFTSPPTKRGWLYRSGDGGMTWREAKLPAGVSATALSLSPQFATDRLVLIGTADGRVLAIPDGMLD